MPKKRILVDYDGCAQSMFQLNDALTTINENDPLYQYLQREVADDCAIAVGSARQTPDLDNRNRFGTLERPREDTGSCFTNYRKLSEKLDCEYNTLLLSDIYYDQESGYVINHPDETKDGSSKSLGLTKKITLMYAHAHDLAASSSSEEPCQLTLVDDDKRVLDTIAAFFKDYPEMLPENITLNLVLYQSYGKDTVAPELQYTIKGSGQVDTNYRQTVKMMLDADCEEKEAFIDPKDLGDRKGPFSKRKLISMLSFDNHLRFSIQDIIPDDVSNMLSLKELFLDSLDSNMQVIFEKANMPGVSDERKQSIIALQMEYTELKKQYCSELLSDIHEYNVSAVDDCEAKNRQFVDRQIEFRNAVIDKVNSFADSVKDDHSAYWKALTADVGRRLLYTVPIIGWVKKHQDNKQQGKYELTPLYIAKSVLECLIPVVGMLISFALARFINQREIASTNTTKRAMTAMNFIGKTPTMELKSEDDNPSNASSHS